MACYRRCRGAQTSPHPADGGGGDSRVDSDCRGSVLGTYGLCHDGGPSCRNGSDAVLPAGALRNVVPRSRRRGPYVMILCYRVGSSATNRRALSRNNPRCRRREGWVALPRYHIHPPATIRGEPVVDRGE